MNGLFGVSVLCRQIGVEHGIWKQKGGLNVQQLTRALAKIRMDIVDVAQSRFIPLSARLIIVLCSLLRKISSLPGMRESRGSPPSIPAGYLVAFSAASAGALVRKTLAVTSASATHQPSLVHLRCLGARGDRWLLPC